MDKEQIAKLESRIANACESFFTDKDSLEDKLCIELGGNYYASISFKVKEIDWVEDYPETCVLRFRSDGARPDKDIFIKRGMWVDMEATLDNYMGGAAPYSKEESLAKINSMILSMRGYYANEWTKADAEIVIAHPVLGNLSRTSSEFQIEFGQGGFDAVAYTAAYRVDKIYSNIISGRLANEAQERIAEIQKALADRIG